tara:strand:+ start:66 stop:293 length:228 start_codon:yes stop_codon:yes gene_type:complete
MNQSAILKVFTRNVYGNATVYPYPGCIVAEQFAALLRVKTFSHSQLQHIEAMGYMIQACPDPKAWGSAVLSAGTL